MEKEKENVRDMHMGKLVHMLSNQLKRRDSMEAGPSDLTHMQRLVLRFILLRSLHLDLYQKDIEEEFHIRKSTATGILQLLEKKGFISRESVEQDGRLKRLVPTKKAEGYREKILENIRENEARMEQGISREDYEACKLVLWKVFENLMEEEKKEERRRRDESKTISINP